MNQEKIYAEKIVAEYVKKDTSKISRLKKLDRKVKTFPQTFALTFGIIATLIMGTGMSFAMKVIGNSMLLGIIIGLLGIFLIIINYPIYKKQLNKRKNKYGSDILRLAEEIVNE